VSNLKKAVIGSVLGLFASIAPASAAVFAVAHPDDDILLMGPNLVNDIRSDYPTVIIVVTAGDANNGNLPQTAEGVASIQYNNKGNPYYRVRLNAREYALDKWVPAKYPRPLVRTWEYFSSAAPAVERIKLGNVIEYHLNLPNRYETAWNTTSLKRFLDGGTPSLQDVEGLNTYTQAGLRETIRQIISRNNHNTPTLVINFHAPISDNRDHPDHTAAGKFVDDAINERPAFHCMWQAIYPGYAEGDIPPNFPGLLDVQRDGYEWAHAVLLDQGNITPVSGGPVDRVAHPNWVPTAYLIPYNDRQKGTMDAFHTNFYGKATWQGAHPSDAPCNL
jgi:LmbE family N-acetylglucosaminyl deacetylase